MSSKYHFRAALPALYILVQSVWASPTHFQGGSLGMSLAKRQADEKGPIVPRDGDFHFGAVGDSWGSGVAWSGNFYDDNKDDCWRVDHAWGTVIRDSGSDWLPSGTNAKLDFVACSGSHLSDMNNQMDKLKETNPKVTFMILGGNDADFYGTIDACVFRTEKDKDYGKNYEDDPNGEGECKKGIAYVRSKIEDPGFRQNMFNAVDAWRNHPVNTGNDASLYALGYAQFFGTGDECNDWDFGVTGRRNNPQKLVKDMRFALNDLLVIVNNIWKEVIEQYKTDKIQYVDIDSAFNGHRFCEPGHGWISQLNWDDKVWIWNNPGRWAYLYNSTADMITRDNGTLSDKDKDLLQRYFMSFNDTKTHSVVDIYGDAGVPADEVFAVNSIPDDSLHFILGQDGANVPNGGGQWGDGYIRRTVHPTKSGHLAMGQAVLKQLGDTFKPPAPAPQKPTKAVSVVMVQSISQYRSQTIDTGSWQFYQTDVGRAVGCKDTALSSQGGNIFDGSGIDNPGWPGGDFSFTAFDDDCEYKNDGQNVGKLFCKNGGEINCFKDDKKDVGKSGTINCSNNVSQRSIHPVTYCQW